MTEDELATTTDVDALWRALRSARSDGDHGRVRALESRMRDVAGHNDDRAHAHRDQTSTDPTVIVSPTETGLG